MSHYSSPDTEHCITLVSHPPSLPRPLPPPVSTATYCKYLVNIDLGDIAINNGSMKNLCVASPSLEIVKGGRFNESSPCVLLRHLPTLRELELVSDSVTGQCFSLLPGSLQRLSVAHCRGLRSDSLRQVGARCPQLRQLDVSGLEQLRAGDLAAALANCPQLEQLITWCLREPAERCLPPAGLPALTQLDLSSAYGVTDTTLRQLPGLLPSLQALNIRGT